MEKQTNMPKLLESTKIRRRKHTNTIWKIFLMIHGAMILIMAGGSMFTKTYSYESLQLITGALLLMLFIPGWIRMTERAVYDEFDPWIEKQTNETPWASSIKELEEMEKKDGPKKV